MKQAKNEHTVLVELAIRNDCVSCEQARSQIEDFILNVPGVNLRTYDLDNDFFIPKEKQSVITPAVWIAGSLCSLGMLDMNNFRKKIEQQKQFTNE